MAPTPITPAKPTDDGIAPMTPVAADAVEGNSLPNGSGLHVILTNTDVSPHTVTLTTPSTVAGVAIDDPVISLSASETKHLGRLSTSAYSTELVLTADSALVEITAYQV